MLRRYTIIIFILLFSLTGCATIKPQFVDPIGRIMPNPHYVLNGIEHPITVLFYYSSLKVMNDIDGTIVSQPTYIDFLKYQDFHLDEIKYINLTIEIRNPLGLEYSLYEEANVTLRDSNVMKTGKELNKSNMKYRQFSYALPCQSDVQDVDHNISLLVNKQAIMQIGHFRYSLLYNEEGGDTY